MMNVDQLPPKLLKKAVNLRNSTRKIYVALCNCQQPQSSSQIADIVGESRAYVNMRLNQLLDQNLIRQVKIENRREKMFTVIQ